MFEVVHKERHPALDARSPIVDISRRYRIKVRYDKIDNILLYHALYEQPHFSN